MDIKELMTNQELLQKKLNTKTLTQEELDALYEIVSRRDSASISDLVTMYVPDYMTTFMAVLISRLDTLAATTMISRTEWVGWEGNLELESLYFTIRCYMMLGDYYNLDLFKNPPEEASNLDKYANVKPVSWYIRTKLYMPLLDALKPRYDRDSEKDTLTRVLNWFEKIYRGIDTEVEKDVVGFQQAIANQVYHEQMHLCVVWDVYLFDIKFGNYAKTLEKAEEVIMDILFKFFASSNNDSIYGLEYDIRPVRGSKMTIATVTIWSTNEDLVKESIALLEEHNDHMREMRK